MRNDLDRLQGLSTFAIELDGYQEKLQPFIELAQFITRSATCEINIIDAFNQWTIARTEDGLKVLPKEQSICQHTVMRDEPHEVKDLKKDDRYNQRFYVKGDPWYRYYCGVQLKSSENINIGSLCVLDTSPKELTHEQKEQLKHLADLVAEKLEQDRNLKMMATGLYEQKKKFRNFSHDMRSPINGIVGIADLLSDDGLGSETDEKLNMLKDCALTITDEMEEVLNSFEEGGAEIVKEELRVSDLIGKIDRLYRPRAESKEITLNLSMDLEEIIRIPKYYAGKITQIVGNLVANALKFTVSGGMVTVLFENQDSQLLHIVVSDDGKGMNPQQVEAFNRQKEVSGTEGTDGEVSYGIGLQLVRDLVSQFGGKISAESTKGKGTRFKCSIPLG